MLYYDSIGVLTPSDRTEANYRRYSEADVKRLEKICRYRETGMSLEDIKQILISLDGKVDTILEKRLDELNQEIRKLHIQRRIIANMLKRNWPNRKINSKLETMVMVLKKAGLDDEELSKLHMKFEQVAPEEHQAFLEFMDLSAEEIGMIREYSRSRLSG